MKKLFELLRKPSRLILLITAFVYAGLYAIVTIGSINGQFLGVIAGIIVFVLTICAVVAIPVLLLLKKEEAAKIVFFVAAIYWLLTRCGNYLGWATVIEEHNDGLANATYVFGFLVGLGLTAVIVLFVLGIALKKEVLKLAGIFTFAGTFFLIFVFFILYLVMLIKYEAVWTSVVSLINELVAPVAVLFGYLYFVGGPQLQEKAAAPKEEKVEEPQPAEEPAKEEEKVEE